MDTKTFNEDQAFTECLKAYRAEDFQHCGEIFAEICENVWPEDLDPFLMKDAKGALGMLGFFIQTGLDQVEAGPVRAFYDRMAKIIIEDFERFNEKPVRVFQVLPGGRA